MRLLSSCVDSRYKSRILLRPNVVVLGAGLHLSELSELREESDQSDRSDRNDQNEYTDASDESEHSQQAKNLASIVAELHGFYSK